MPGGHNPGHGKRPDRPSSDVETRDLAARNQEAGDAAGMSGEEPRDIRKAGGGTRGMSLGGAHTGRYAGAPSKVVSDRERKPRGSDKHE